MRSPRRWCSSTRLTNAKSFSVRTPVLCAQLTAVVQEREAKLRSAMRTMGMMDSAFWLSWATYEAACDFVTSMLLCAFGAIWQV